MAKHGCHVGRKTAHGSVISYVRGRYTAQCNCGVTFRVNTRQATFNSLACPACLVEYHSANGKKAKGWSLRPYVHNPKPKRVRKPRANVGTV